MPTKPATKTKKTEAPKKVEPPKKVVVVEEVVETLKEEVKPVEGKTESVEPVKPVVLEEDETPEPEKQEPEKEESDTDTSAVEEAEEVVEVDESEDIEEEKPKTGKLLWIIIPTTLLVGALAGGIITYFSGVSKIDSGDKPTPIATISPDSETTASPEPEGVLKRDGLKVQVLNGSGVAGAAGKAQTLLQDLGYLKVAVGNAGSSDFTTTEISIKADKNEYLEMLIEDLSDSYSVDSKTATLSATSDYDAVVTLGSK